MKTYPEVLMSKVSWEKINYKEKIISYDNLDFETLFNINYEGLFGWAVFMICRKTEIDPIEITYRREVKQ